MTHKDAHVYPRLSQRYCGTIDSMLKVVKYGWDKIDWSWVSPRWSNYLCKWVPFTASVTANLKQEALATVNHELLTVATLWIAALHSTWGCLWSLLGNCNWFKPKRPAYWQMELLCSHSHSGCPAWQQVFSDVMFSSIRSYIVWNLETQLIEAIYLRYLVQCRGEM